jgi:chemotaxis protein MotC
MKLWRALLAGLFIAVLATGSCRAEAKPPYEVIRSLESLHDQMVAGSRPAQTAMPNVLRQLGARLMAAEPSVWKDPRNTRAIVIYILSGGEIRVARKVLATGTAPAAEKQLIEGALAYLEGLKPQAKGLLGNVDPRSLEAVVGSHIALAQAALIADEKPDKAIKLLDLARVLAPGTLVEDAALRREVFLAEETSDFDKFIAMADQYFRRFNRSVYAESFQREFAIALTRISQSGNARQLASLSTLLNDVSARDQLRLYLHVAQASIVNGKPATARWAAMAAMVLAAKNTLDAHRAALYDGVASVLSSDYDPGLAELKGLESVRFSASDAQLREAAMGLAMQIRQWPAPAPAKTEDGIGENAPLAVMGPPPQLPPSVLPTLASTVKSTDGTIANAEKMLADSKALLEGNDQ